MNDQPIDTPSKELWQRAMMIYLASLQSSDERNQTERYLSMISNVSQTDDVIKVFTVNNFAADFLSQNYATKFKSALDLAGGEKTLKIEFVVDENSKTTVVLPTQKIKVKPTAKVSSFVSTMPLNPEYTFEEFVEGPSNSFALAAAKGTIKDPGNKKYNPLFIHGGSGLGKTHLMQSIGNELKRRDPSLAICYLTAEEFMNEYINHLQNHRQMEFRSRYRSIDVLLLDDVQFFQRGKEVVEEFFNTFCALRDKGKQIVMTCDVAPKNLPSMENRLITRFESGIVQEIESPSYETRLAILKKKAESYEVKVADSVLEFIADNIKSHVRAMEGALSNVSICYESNPNIILDKPRLSVLLKDFIDNENSLRKLTTEEIQTAVSRKYNISIKQLLSTERTQSLVTPRQLAMYIARKYTTNSLPEIAKKFDKTHATILHGVKNITKRLDVEPDLKLALSEVLAEFGHKMTDTMS